MALITLTTDFGLSDTFLGQLKGVILGIAPEVWIVDITHDVRPQDVLGGALVLESAVGAFPDGTVHVGVVDPEVGTDRPAIAVRTDKFTFVGPDNGLFTAVLAHDEPRVIVRLTNPQYHRRPTSATFHGRDVFAPVAAHLIRGTPIEQFGERVGGYVRLELPRPARKDGGLELHVIHIDRFGNLVTDLTRPDYENWRGTRDDLDASLIVGKHEFKGVHSTFADVAHGKPVAYFGSSNRLEIAVCNGNASQTMGVKERDAVRMTLAV